MAGDVVSRGELAAAVACPPAPGGQYWTGNPQHEIRNTKQIQSTKDPNMLSVIPIFGF
jgi:hypothetical protein